MPYVHEAEVASLNFRSGIPSCNVQRLVFAGFDCSESFLFKIIIIENDLIFLAVN